MKNKTTNMNKPKRGESSTLRKNAQVNLRLPQADLDYFKKIAENDFIPCQTIIASILHKYVIGRIVEKPEHEIKIPKQREAINNRQYNQRTG